VKVFKILWKCEEYFSSVSLAIMTIVTFIAVCSRYSFHYPLPWSEEVVRFLFVWTTFVGASVAVRYGSHVGINVLTDRLPVSSKKPVAVIGALLGVSFCIVLFNMGYMQMIAQSNQESAVLRLNMAYVYLAVPVGSVLMAISILKVLWDQFKDGTIVEGECE
jgi:TRAP-type C4-dicarboxylate transport system permease small subunit